jgi:hypothetical protein
VASMKPALVTPTQLAVVDFVRAHPGCTSLDLVATGFARSTLTDALHSLWRAGVLARGRTRLVTRTDPRPPYGYLVARDVRPEPVPDTMINRVVAELRKRPATSRELAAVAGGTPRAISSMLRVRGWPSVRDPGHPRRLVWQVQP